MMTRKTLHHHRRRERGREKKKANLHLLRAHGGLCITTLLKTCIKTSSSPNKYSYIYIFFTSFVSKAEPFLLCGTKLCIVQKYSGKAFVFPSPRRRASPFPLIHALSLVQHTCITVKNNKKTRPLLQSHAITAWAQKMHTGTFIADACCTLRHTQRKEAFSFTQSQPSQAAHNFNDSQSQANLCSQRLWKLPRRMIEKEKKKKQYIWQLALVDPNKVTHIWRSLTNCSLSSSQWEKTLEC